MQINVRGAAKRITLNCSFMQYIQMCLCPLSPEKREKSNELWGGGGRQKYVDDLI